MTVSTRLPGGSRRTRADSDLDAHTNATSTRPNKAARSRSIIRSKGENEGELNADLRFLRRPNLSALWRTTSCPIVV